ncbi:outer membrane protein TolC [Salinibacter ruber]|uniref:Outer membrane protein TolC n=1 Tax=Salinibacter ruber TaxID=146919 RepID=A0A9X2PY78_9BACT|nr:TolC family protein [Salinibacter ruber]MCS3676268.1 outer membrane protein TolC [Salinibacter ruber]MCS3679555.1 outer membrane protein TolC [Salinibacter ruber]
MSIRFSWPDSITAVLFATLLFGFQPAFGQQENSSGDSAVLHLDSLLQAADRANPSLRAARLRAEAQALKEPQASSLPDLTVQGTGHVYPTVTARGPQRSQWQVRQAIPFPGKRGLRGEVAARGADAAEADAEALAQNLALRIETAYYELYRVQRREELLHAFEEQLRQFESAASTRYEVGDGSQQAILKAQVERGRLEMQRENLRAERGSALQSLVRLTGRSDLEAPTQPVDVTAPSNLKEVGERAGEEATADRPEAEALRRRIEKAESEMALARRAFWPDFTVGAAYTDVRQDDLTPTMSGRDAFTLSVGVSIPLWRGKQEARLEEATVERRRAEAELEDFRLGVQAEVRDLRERIGRQQRQLTLLGEQLLPQAESSLEATLSAYKAGRTDFLDLLDAERTLFQLRLDYEDTHARALQTAAKLDHTLGQISLSGDRP